MTLWWLSDFARVGREKAAVEQLAADVDWFDLTRWTIDGYRLAAEGVLTAHGVAYPVRLTYPDLFPAVPAWVQPQDPEARWSGHQYGNGGSLCLELRPDNWSPAATGADVVQSAFNLLDTENPLGEGEHGTAATDHRIGEVQAYTWGREPVLVRVGCLQRLAAGAQGVTALRWLADDEVWPILVYDAVDQARAKHPPSLDISSFRSEIPVLVSASAAPAERSEQRDQLLAALDLVTELPPERAMLVIAAGGATPQAFHSPKAEEVFSRKWIVLPDDSEMRSGRAPSSRDKRVAVVGVGSVGSKVAETLLRSGITNLHLVDGDVMLPGNLERHILDWRDVGFRKAFAVRRRLLHIAPGVKITTTTTNLDWQRSARTAASELDAIADCDLIVDATGSATASLLLGAVAADSGKPFVSVEAFEGGLGCLVARALPGRDPPYLAGRQAYQAFCDERDVAPPMSGRARYEAFSDDGQPLVADDAAITITAGHTARVILDILDGTVGPYDTAWLLFGFKAGWMFSRHGELIALDLGGPTPPSPRADDPDARAFATMLAQEALRAAQHSE